MDGLKFTEPPGPESLKAAGDIQSPTRGNPLRPRVQVRYLMRLKNYMYVYTYITIILYYIYIYSIDLTGQLDYYHCIKCIRVPRY